MTLALPVAAPEDDFNVYTVSPGIEGFIAFFVFALVAWLLFRSMTRHMRRVDRNAKLRAEQETDGVAPRSRRAHPPAAPPEAASSDPAPDDDGDATPGQPAR